MKRRNTVWRLARLLMALTLMTSAFSFARAKYVEGNIASGASFKIHHYFSYTPGQPAPAGTYAFFVRGANGVASSGNNGTRLGGVGGSGGALRGLYYYNGSGNGTFTVVYPTGGIGRGTGGAGGAGTCILAGTATTPASGVYTNIVAVAGGGGGGSAATSSYSGRVGGWAGAAVADNGGNSLAADGPNGYTSSNASGYFWRGKNGDPGANPTNYQTGANQGTNGGGGYSAGGNAGVGNTNGVAGSWFTGGAGANSTSNSYHSGGGGGGIYGGGGGARSSTNAECAGAGGGGSSYMNATCKATSAAPAYCAQAIADFNAKANALQAGTGTAVLMVWLGPENYTV